MPKKTVRVDIPTSSPDKLCRLVKKVWDHHISLGASSPFASNTLVDMTQYQALMNTALEKRERALALYAEAQALMQESRVALGIDYGQKVSNLGTLHHSLTNIKQILKATCQGNEEDLSLWGFNVVIGSSAVGAKKKKKA